jgi:hypothetical protein
MAIDPHRKLIPAERKDGSWGVKVERPDALPEDIGDFNSQAEAQDWIIHGSTTYFQKRDGQK